MLIYINYCCMAQAQFRCEFLFLNDWNMKYKLIYFCRGNRVKRVNADNTIFCCSLHSSVFFLLFLEPIMNLSHVDANDVLCEQMFTYYLLL